MPGMLETATAIAAVLVGYLAVAAFPLLYVLVRWRSAGVGEPGLGTYGAIHYFRSVSLLIMLTALAVLVYIAMSEEDPRQLEEVSRIAKGLFTGAACIFVVHLVLGWQASRSLSGREDPVSRVFSGFVLLLAGSVTAAAVLVLFVLLFQEDPEDEPVRAAISFLLVWGLGYAGQLALMVFGARKSSG